MYIIYLFAAEINYGLIRRQVRLTMFSISVESPKPRKSQYVSPSTPLPDIPISSVTFMKSVMPTASKIIPSLLALFAYGIVFPGLIFDAPSVIRKARFGTFNLSPF